MILNRIPITFGSLSKITGPTISYQYDAVQFLVFYDLELPEYYEVDFCNDGDSDTITMIGTADGVQIPDDFLQTGKPVKAYVVVTGTDEGAVETRKELTLPVRKRPTRTDIEPTPAEQQQIDQLVLAMNQAVEDSRISAEESERQAGIAEDKANEAESKATLAESWAVGGTGTRPGEDSDNAKHYAELAEQGAEESGYAWFDVHDDDGHMHVYISDNLSEDVSFAIDEFKGHLEVTYN